jgi:hypothetical protein
MPPIKFKEMIITRYGRIKIVLYRRQQSNVWHSSGTSKRKFEVATSSITAAILSIRRTMNLFKIFMTTRFSVQLGYCRRREELLIVEKAKNCSSAI